MTSLLLLLACEVAPPPPPPSFEDDLDAICTAIYGVKWNARDEEWDAAMRAAVLHTPEGEALRAGLVEGEPRNRSSLDALVQAIRDTEAFDSSIDCALVEGYAPTLKPPGDDEESTMDAPEEPG